MVNSSTGLKGDGLTVDTGFPLQARELGTVFAKTLNFDTSGTDTSIIAAIGTVAASTAAPIIVVGLSLCNQDASASSIIEFWSGENTDGNLLYTVKLTADDPGNHLNLPIISQPRFVTEPGDALYMEITGGQPVKGSIWYCKGEPNTVYKLGAALML